MSSKYNTSSTSGASRLSASEQAIATSTRSKLRELEQKFRSTAGPSSFSQAVADAEFQKRLKRVSSLLKDKEVTARSLARQREIGKYVDQTQQKPSERGPNEKRTNKVPSKNLLDRLAKGLEPEYWTSYLGNSRTLSTSSTSSTSKSQQNPSSSNSEAYQSPPELSDSGILQQLLRDSQDGDQIESRTSEDKPSQQKSTYYQFNPTAVGGHDKVKSAPSRSAGTIGQPSQSLRSTSTDIPMGNGDNKADFRIKQSEKNDYSFTPLLLRMPNTAFGVPMGLAGNAIMWKAAGEVDFVTNLIDTELPNTILWFAAFILGILITFCFLYKIIFSFRLVAMEYKDPTRIHFFYAPHLTLLLLSLGIPSVFDPSSSTLQIIFAVGLLLQFGITQMIYEKSVFAKQSNLAQAKPQFLLSVIGWFLLTILGQKVDIAVACGIALPTFCFGVGIFSYIVVTANVFNGLHQDKHQNMRSPSLTLLLAPPSVAAIAIDGFSDETHDYGFAHQIFLGWALLLLLLLLRLGSRIVQNPPVFGSYCAYVFPMAALASACLRYSTLSSTSTTEYLALVSIGVATISLCIVFFRMFYNAILCLLQKARWGDPLLDTSDEGDTGIRDSSGV